MQEKLIINPSYSGLQPTIIDPLLIYTDGACNMNWQSAGGYGLTVSILNTSKIVYEESGYTKHTTNNRMEIVAVYQALKFLKSANFLDCIIRSDSQYVVNSFNAGWLEKWHKAKYKKIKNVDLWQKIYPLYLDLKDQFTIEWVRGHNGDLLNEYVDRLADTAMKKNFSEEEKKKLQISLPPMYDKEFNKKVDLLKDLKTKRDLLQKEIELIEKQIDE